MISLLNDFRMMVAFCNRIAGLQPLSLLLGDYTKRLGFGIRPEIIPLVEIKGKHKRFSFNNLTIVI